MSFIPEQNTSTYLKQTAELESTSHKPQIHPNLRQAIHEGKISPLLQVRINRTLMQRRQRYHEQLINQDSQIQIQSYANQYKDSGHKPGEAAQAYMNGDYTNAQSIVENINNAHKSSL